jgi:small subunit ribosomal protein S18
MARSSNNERTRRSAKDAARKTKKKPCALCRDKVEWVDYKDVGMLRKYMSDRGKIRARRVTGNCTQHQRDVALAIKTARELVLLPYTQRTMTERSGGRGRGRPDRQERPAGPGPAGEAGEAGEAGNGGVASEEELELSENLAGELAEGIDEDLAEAEADELGVSGNGAEVEAAAEPDDEPAASNGSSQRDVTGDGA